MSETKRRNELVLKVLKNNSSPLSPGEIGRRIGEPWCMWGDGYGKSAPVSAVLKRIKEVCVKRGQWIQPE